MSERRSGLDITYWAVNLVFLLEGILCVIISHLYASDSFFAIGMANVFVSLFLSILGILYE